MPRLRARANWRESCERKVSLPRRSDFSVSQELCTNTIPCVHTSEAYSAASLRVTIEIDPTIGPGLSCARADPWAARVTHPPRRLLADVDGRLSPAVRVALSASRPPEA